MKFLLVALLALSSTGCYTYTWIDSGHVGVKVTASGTNKGIDPKPYSVGRVWYNWTYESVYEFPVYEQNVRWCKDGGEFGNESLDIATKGGQKVNVDVGLTYDIDDEAVPAMFGLLRKDVKEITHHWLKNKVNDALSHEAREMETMHFLSSGATEVLDSAKEKLNVVLKEYGFKIKMLTFASAPRPDPTIQTSIDATLTAKQLAVQAENKVAQSKAEADQEIEKARGRAQSVIVEAEAKFKAAELEAKANEVLSKSLTPELIRYSTMQKWNGSLPKITGGVMPLMDISSELK